MLICNIPQQLETLYVGKYRICSEGIFGLSIYMINKHCELEWLKHLSDRRNLLYTWVAFKEESQAINKQLG